MPPESHIVAPQGSPTPEENTIEPLELVEVRHLFVAVQFGPDTEAVMMPVDDLAIMDTPEGKEQVLDAAWRFYQHGQFVRAEGGFPPEGLSSPQLRIPPAIRERSAESQRRPVRKEFCLLSTRDRASQMSD